MLKRINYQGSNIPVMMTLLLIAILLFNFHSYAQEVLERRVDTLKKIKLQYNNVFEIKYIDGQKEFYFSKAATLKTLKKILPQLEDPKAGEVELLRNYKRIYEYIKNTKNIINLSDPWGNDTITDIQQIDININLLTSLEFRDIACEMLESGDFGLILNKVRQKNIYMARVYERQKYSSTTSIKYILKSGVELWECPPIVHDDFTTP